MSRYEHKVGIELYCKDCGKELDADIWGIKVNVVPCNDCEAEAFNSGMDQGWEDCNDRNKERGE